MPVGEALPRGRTVPATRSRTGLPRAAAAALLLAIALAFGVVAVLVSGAPTAAPAPATFVPATGVSLEEVDVFAALLIALFWAYPVYQRLTGGSDNYPAAAVVIALAVVTGLVAFALFLEAVGAYELAHETAGPPASTTCPSSDPSCRVPPPPPPSKGNIPVPPAGHGGIPWVVPTWGLYVLVAVGVAVVALLLLPLLAGWMKEAPPGPAPGGGEGAEAARAHLADAMRRLDGPGGTDPRAVIVGLYGGFIGGVARRSSLDVEPLTPREIERWCIGTLGAQPSNARALTELFEEARYSSRPMGPADAGRAREAVAAVLRDLDARRPPPGGG
jgi:hypothetical protein